jgi:hypothetical protein
LSRYLVRKAWAATGYAVEPANYKELMATIGAVGTYSTGQRFAWRGMSSADYQLSSSLHRDLGIAADEAAVHSSESETILKAHEWGLGVTQLGNVDDLQLLADLQHYGVPTRLIDVTSDPMTAVWFACQSPGVDGAIKAGLILAINITSFATRVALPTQRDTREDAENWTSSALEAALENGKPFLVRAAEANPRLASQAGYFITGRVPGSPTDVFTSLDVPFTPRSTALDLLADRAGGRPESLPFVAIIVKSHLKRKLLQYLDGTYNKSARTLFPDYAGFREFESKVGTSEPSGAV